MPNVSTAQWQERPRLQRRTVVSMLAPCAQDIRFQRGGELRIATLPSLSQSLLPRVTTRFLLSRPNVSVFVQSLPSRQIADLVATRQ